MAAEDPIVEHLRDLLAPLGGVSFRRMFGGHGVYRDGLMFGLVAFDTFYLKVDDENRARFEAEGLGPFVYEGKGKPMVLSYHRPPDAALDDASEMRPWAESGYAAARRAAAAKPAPKPRAPKPRTPKATPKSRPGGA